MKQRLQIYGDNLANQNLDTFSAPKLTWLQTKNNFVLVIAIIVVPIIAHAGGLGMMAWLVLCSWALMLGHNPLQISAAVRKIPLPIWCIFLLLIWGFITSMWSPYQSGDTLSNPVKLLLGVPFALSFAAYMKARAKLDTHRITSLVVVFGFVAAFFFLLDYLTSFGLTKLVDPIEEGVKLGVQYADTLQNLGHGLTILTLMAFPIMGMLLTKTHRARWLAFVLPVIIIVCAYKGLLDICILAIILGGAFMAIAHFRPILTVWASFILAICTVLFAPILALITSMLSPELKAAIPPSWEERLENWGFLYGKIMQHPFFGNGFDAVRTFDDMHVIRGVEKIIVSLHPHNGGIHIWVELGAVGAVIVCIALFLGARHLTAPGRLSKEQMVAVSGLVIAVTLIANVSFGVWQDWWWGAIIYAASLVALIGNTEKNKS